MPNLPKQGKNQWQEMYQNAAPSKRLFVEIMAFSFVGINSIDNGIEIETHETTTWLDGKRIKKMQYKITVDLD